MTKGYTGYCGLVHGPHVDLNYVMTFGVKSVKLSPEQAMKTQMGVEV